MQKVQQRSKRLDFKRKMDILAKEKKDESLIREVRAREGLLVNQRFNNLVQNNIDKKMFMTEMDVWAHSGFNTTRSSKSR